MAAISVCTQSPLSIKNEVSVTNGQWSSARATLNMTDTAAEFNIKSNK